MLTRNFDGAGKVIDIQMDGVKQKAHHTWFRGEHCNFNPKAQNLRDANAVEKFVIDGWAPEKPIIGPDTKVVAFGSCFAANITNWLSKRNFNVLTKKDGRNSNSYVVRFGEGMVNSFVIRQQFEWAFENRSPDADLWHDYNADSFGYDETVRKNTEQMFMAADVFIITLGLSEIWYDEKTGGVFWRAVPQDKYDPARHKFRVSTVQENKENIRAIFELIQKHRPEAKVIFTLSPIPLVATFRDNSCITSNSVSKSILRAALDETLRELGDNKNAFYWPSYEIVMDVFGNRWRYNRRHVQPPILDFIMTLFEKTWCYGSTAETSLPEAWMFAQSVAGEIPHELGRAFRNQNVIALSRFVKNRTTQSKNGRRIFEEDINLIHNAASEFANRNPDSLVAKWVAGKPMGYLAVRYYLHRLALLWSKLHKN